MAGTKKAMNSRAFAQMAMLGDLILGSVAIYIYLNVTGRDRVPDKMGCDMTPPETNPAQSQRGSQRVHRGLYDSRSQA